MRLNTASIVEMVSAAVFPVSRAASVTRDFRSCKTSTGRAHLQMMRSPSQWPASPQPHAWRTGGLLRGSGGAVSQRRFHGRASLESSEHLHGCDGGAGEFRRDIVGDGSEAENLDEKRCPGIAGRLEILPLVVRQPELELPAGHRVADRVLMPFELVSNGCADEVSPIGVEGVPNHEAHAPEIDEAQVDRDFFSLSGVLCRSPAGLANASATSSRSLPWLGRCGETPLGAQ
jgi:hypothetical protein